MVHGSATVSSEILSATHDSLSSAPPSSPRHRRHHHRIRPKTPPPQPRPIPSSPQLWYHAPTRVCLIIPAHPEPRAPPELRSVIPSFPPEPRQSVREEEEDGPEPVLICLGTLAVAGTQVVVLPAAPPPRPPLRL
jgi:UDP:flavonoid glycosyltransferase YjiC (YdhE family)